MVGVISEAREAGWCAREGQAARKQQGVITLYIFMPFHVPSGAEQLLRKRNEQMHTFYWFPKLKEV